MVNNPSFITLKWCSFYYLLINAIELEDVIIWCPEMLFVAMFGRFQPKILVTNSLKAYTSTYLKYK